MFSTPSQYTNYKIRGKSIFTHPCTNYTNLSYYFISGYVFIFRYCLSHHRKDTGVINLQNCLSLEMRLSAVSGQNVAGGYRCRRKWRRTLFQSGIFEEDDQQPVLAVQLLQISQLAIWLPGCRKIGIQHQRLRLLTRLFKCTHNEEKSVSKSSLLAVKGALITPAFVRAVGRRDKCIKVLINVTSPVPPSA